MFIEKNYFIIYKIKIKKIYFNIKFKNKIMIKIYKNYIKIYLNYYIKNKLIKIFK